MNIIADLHTHTNVSAHAFSTLHEMAGGAKTAGMLAFAMTNHGPAMPDGAHEWHFANMDILPRKMEGVTLIRGIEFNICAPTGSIDMMQKKCLHPVEFALASFHECCFPPSTKQNHTEALENILKNPLVNAFGHLGNPNFSFDMEHIISKCNEYGKLIEINNNSVNVRRGSKENCAEIARLCKKYQVPVVVDSDSHVEYTIGRMDVAKALLEEIDFPEELVVNSSMERLDAYFKGRGLHLFE